VLAHGLDEVEVALNPLLADAELAARKCWLFSSEIDISIAEFSITHFSRRNPGLEKSRTYTRETAKIGPSLFKLSLAQFAH
jgi:hypothetical protein